jgi:hypothetical protein
MKFDATALVCIGKLALVAPCGTVTLEGIMHGSLGLFSARVTIAPPNGAPSIRCTVPVRGLPPVTLAELKLIEDKNEIRRAALSPYCAEIPKPLSIKK